MGHWLQEGQVIRKQHCHRAPTGAQSTVIKNRNCPPPFKSYQQVGVALKPCLPSSSGLVRIAANMLFLNKLSPSQGHKCCLSIVQRPVQSLYCVWVEGGSREEGTTSSWLYKLVRAVLTVSSPHRTIWLTVQNPSQFPARNIVSKTGKTNFIY